MTALVYDEIFLRHDTGDHPENSGRLETVTRHLREKGLWDKLDVVAPRKAAKEEILACHVESLYRIAEEVSASGGGYLDPDTVLSEDSFEAALYAAGAVLTAADMIEEGKAKRAFCMVRPPGHHAERDRAMGFCIFNNIAIGARYLLNRHGRKKILIFDFDGHHGNGTQREFYES